LGKGSFEDWLQTFRAFFSVMKTHKVWKNRVVDSNKNIENCWFFDSLLSLVVSCMAKAFTGGQATWAEESKYVVTVGVPHQSKLM